MESDPQFLRYMYAVRNNFVTAKDMQCIKYWTYISDIFIAYLANLTRHLLPYEMFCFWCSKIWPFAIIFPSVFWSISLWSRIHKYIFIHTYTLAHNNLSARKWKTRSMILFFSSSPTPTPPPPAVEFNQNLIEIWLFFFFFSSFLNIGQGTCTLHFFIK